MEWSTGWCLIEDEELVREVELDEALYELESNDEVTTGGSNDPILVNSDDDDTSTMDETTATADRWQRWCSTCF